jgi:hypothetical protein
MQKKLTITHDEEIYVIDSSLDNRYMAMAADREREAEAAEWCDALVRDFADGTGKQPIHWF